MIGVFFFSSRRRHTRYWRDWSSDVCSSDLRDQQALTRDEAAVVTQALRRVITDGTASYYHDLDEEIGRPSAGKTGTTNNFVDARFVGVVPQLTTSVWVGSPEERTPMVNINGLPEINGEHYPLDRSEER